MSKGLALIVPVLNQFELFTQMMSTVNYPVHPYIVKNWENNVGVAAGWNQGMRRAMKDGHRYALITNDDVIFEKEAVSSIYTTIRETGVTAVSPNFCVPERDGKDMYFDRNLGLIESMHWSSFIVDMYKLVENCGWFDENFYPAYFEDNDMHYRMSLANQQFVVNTQHGFYHKQSATCVTIITQHMWDNCQGYYITKWGGLPGEERYTSPFDDSSKKIDYWRKSV